MRIEGRGLIDRSLTVPFSFDGQRMTGFRGDTIASALLANGIRLVGRSFKYHRPRGILTAGSEEPNALVTIGREAGQEPNVRATVQELVEGLEVVSQNRWPSLRRDALAVNDLLAPFLGAGFYYKTFMWPRAFWERLYEPAIRRAAGLGALSGETNADPYEKAFAFCDLLVIGAGPAGLMAALTAARSGADVILATEDSRVGGRLLAETEAVAGQPGPTWAEGVAAELRALPNVRLMTRTTVTGAYDHGVYGALERVGADLSPAPHLPRECFWRITATRAILCAGGLERPIAFPDNDRPGIMLASALRAYLNRWGVAAGREIAIFANNDDGHRTARDLLSAGLLVAGVIDARAEAPDSSDYPVFRAGRVIGTSGRLGLTSVTIRHAGGQRSLRADCLAVAGGWNPTLHLTCHLGARPLWQEDIAAFVPPEGAVPGLAVAGSARGLTSTAACLADGIAAARTALADLGRTAPDLAPPEGEDRAWSIAPLWAVEGRGRAWLDFQNDVTVKDVKRAAQEGFQSVEHMKRYTTQGMAPDQGKSSNVAALALLADATGRAIPQAGTTTFRPPFVPVSIAAMGAGGQGKGFAPERLTPSHGASLDRGAPMIEAGQWYRPSYFPKPGETTWQHSCDREVRMVRQAVGICDVSTLGKIDVQGPDAAEFLDFVYANTISTLPEGRVRYGLMLREDGHVMDDGTVARLCPRHFLVTTTTAAAGLVMRHLELVAQTIRPDLDVSTVSVTDHWAQFAVAGPLARRLLNSILDTPLGEGDFPYMACGPVSVCGTPGRLYRISFSGEHAYEIAVPAAYGANLWRLLLTQAETLGGGPYGMEALNVLRIEKGLLTHAEMHGRTTAFDLGLDRMVSMKKDCIGRAASRRPGLLDEGREQLVGLRPRAPRAPVPAGAHLFAPGMAPLRVNDQGYVTSTCHSPTLGTTLGLGFLARGRARLGETIRAVDRLRGIETEVEVCDPVFFDPEGGRLRG